MTNTAIINTALQRLRRRWPYALVVMLIAGIPSLLFTFASYVLQSRFYAGLNTWLETVSLQSGGAYTTQELLTLFLSSQIDALITEAQAESLLKVLYDVFTPGMQALLWASFLSTFALAFLNIGACAYLDKVARGENAAIRDVFSRWRLIGRAALILVLKLLMILGVLLAAILATVLILYFAQTLSILPLIGFVVLLYYLVTVYTNADIALVANPGLSAAGALRESRRGTRGQFFSLFILVFGIGLVHIVLGELLGSVLSFYEPLADTATMLLSFAATVLSTVARCIWWRTRVSGDFVQVQVTQPDA